MLTEAAKQGSAVSRLILYCKLGGIQQASFLPCATHLLYLLFSFFPLRLLLPPSSNQNGERQHGLICPLGITRNKKTKASVLSPFLLVFLLPSFPFLLPSSPTSLSLSLSRGIILTLCAINDTFPFFCSPFYPAKSLSGICLSRGEKKKGGQDERCLFEQSAKINIF